MPSPLTPSATTWLSNQASRFPGGATDLSYLKFKSRIQSSSKLIDELNLATNFNNNNTDIINGIQFDPNISKPVAQYNSSTDQNVYITSGFLSGSNEQITYVISHEFAHALNRSTTKIGIDPVINAIKSQSSTNNDDYTNLASQYKTVFLNDEASADIYGANAVIGALFDAGNGAPVSIASTKEALELTGYSDHYFSGSVLRPGITTDANGFLLKTQSSISVISDYYGGLNTSNSGLTYSQYYTKNLISYLCDIDKDHNFSLNFSQLSLNRSRTGVFITAEQSINSLIIVMEKFVLLFRLYPRQRKCAARTHSILRS